MLNAIFDLRSASKRLLSKSSLEVTKKNKNRPAINLLEKPQDKKKPHRYALLKNTGFAYINKVHTVYTFISVVYIILYYV